VPNDNFPRTALIATPIALAVVLLTALFASASNRPQAATLSGSGGGAIATDPNIKVAFIGDSANGANFQAVLNLIESEGADLVMHQGDFDYVYDADGFFGTIDSVLGPTFPYLASVGNHDVASWSESCGDPDGCYATFLKQRMAATGITPDDPNLNDQMYSTEFHGLGMVFVGENGAAATECSTNPNGYACYIRNELQTDRHIWRICSWHKNQQAMQVGGKTNEMGWFVYDACTDLSALILTAHEHSYERTKTLTNPQTQAVDVVQHPLVDGVPGNPNSLRVKPGSTPVFVSGLGGNSMRPQLRCLPAAYPYGCNYEWASIYTTNQTPGGASRYGALFIEFYVDGDPYKARGYFKNTLGETIDTFEIRADFTDMDGDGIQDGIDNCPDWQNPNQANPPWGFTTGDGDCDGFPDTVAGANKAAETTLGTALSDPCADVAGNNNEPPPDAWPVDFNDSQTVTGPDILGFGPVFGAMAPNPPFDARYDLTGDGKITGPDLLTFGPFFGQNCTTLPAGASAAPVQQVAWIQPEAGAATANGYSCDVESTVDPAAFALRLPY
jgi:hypothetical protein